MPPVHLPSPPPHPPPSQRRAPRLQIPGYDLLREISQGGQAVVYEATQKSTKRKVAVKVLHERWLAGAQQRARFEREVKVLGTLDHPNIVRIVDRGRTPDGMTFLVMDFIQGQPLDQFWRRWKRFNRGVGLPPGDAGPTEGKTGKKTPELRLALALFAKIAETVSAAHVRGIVHRDLKPSNILVDHRHEPHVVDFGLARIGLESGTDTQGQQVSRTGQFLGSLPWASPEQAEGSPDNIDVRSDVYSLGVILYQLVTGGRFPYDVSGGMREALNNIVSAEPDPPSKAIEADDAATLAAAAAAARSTAPARKRHWRRSRGGAHIDPALDAIVLKALAKRPADRYQSAGELAGDVTAFLTGKPVVAAGGRPAGWQRRRRIMILSAAVAVLLSVALGAWLALRQTSDPGSPAQRKGHPGDPTLASVAVAAPTSPARMSALAFVDRPAPLPGALSWTIAPAESMSAVSTLAYSPDGRQLAAAGRDGAIRIRDVASRKLLRVLIGHNQPVWRLIWSTDGSRLVSADGERALTWDPATGAAIAAPAIPAGVGLKDVALSPDGKLLALARANATQVLSLDGAGAVTTLDSGGGVGVGFSADNRLLAVSYTNGVVRTYHARTGVQQRELPPDSPGIGGRLVWAATGNQLASVGSYDDGRVALWDGLAGKRMSGRVRASANPSDLAFLADGTGLVEVARGVRVWATTANRQPARFEQGTTIFTAVACAPDGTSAALADGVGRLTFLDGRLTHEQSPGVSAGPGSVKVIGWSPDGKYLATYESAVDIWDSGLRGPLNAGFAWFRPIRGQPWSADATQVVMVIRAMNKRPAIYNVSDGKQVRELEDDAGGKSPSYLNLNWSPGETDLIAGGGTDRVVRIWKGSTGKRVATLEAMAAAPTTTWAPDGRRLAVVGGAAAALRIWNADTGVFAPPIAAAGVSGGVAWGPSPAEVIAARGPKTLLAVGENAGSITLWDPDTGKPYKTLSIGPARRPEGIRFSRDGQRLAAQTSDGAVRAWSTVTWSEVSAFEQRTLPVEHRADQLDGQIDFAPDHRTLLTSGPTGLIFHDTTENRPKCRLVCFAADRTWAIIAADGHLRAAAGTADRFVYVVRTADGTQRTLTAAEFGRNYGWKNEPGRVRIP